MDPSDNWQKFKPTDDTLPNVNCNKPKHTNLQRLEWINLIIAQVWPYLDGFLKLVLQSVEEDSKLKSRLAGYHIHSLSFPHGSLGKIPPKLTGIKFHQATQRDEVILGTIDTLLTYYTMDLSSASQIFVR